MNIPQQVKEVLLGAEGKSLATTGSAGLTVIPVSTILKQMLNTKQKVYDLRKQKRELLKLFPTGWYMGC